MQLKDFLALAAEFNRLGWTVQEQLQAVVDGEALDGQNANALQMIERFLRREAAVLLGDGEADSIARADAIRDYLATLE